MRKNKIVVLLLLVAIMVLSAALVACVPIEEPHVCGHVCETCKKCTDSTCTNSVCADKCQGHEEPEHEKCPNCEGCLDLSCTKCEYTCECIITDAQALANAVQAIKIDYKEKTTITASTTDFSATRSIGGYEEDRTTRKTFTVSVVWTLENVQGVDDTVSLTKKDDGSAYTLAVVYSSEHNTAATTFTLKAVITCGDETDTWTLDSSVPQFNYTSYEDYCANCKTGAKTIMNIKGYVIGAVANSSGSSGSFYMMDADGNGYYVYKPTFGSDFPASGDKSDLETLQAYLPYGTEVIVSGTGTVYSGQYEFNSGCTFVKTGNTAASAGVTLEYLDVTEAFGSAESNKDTALIPYQNRLVTLTGVVMTAHDYSNKDDYYYYFKVNDVQYNLYSTIYFMSKEDSATLFEKFEIGSTATIKGLVSVYSNSYQIYPIALDAISNVQKPSRTDAEAVAFEKEQLTFAEIVNESKSITLPAAGTAETGVVITWEFKAETAHTTATIADGKLNITLGEEAETITLVATLKQGEATDTKEFQVEVKPIEPISIADFLEKEKGDTIYAVKGWVVAAGADKGSAGSFVIADSTGAVFSYNSATVEVGKMYIVYGTRADNYGTPQIGTTNVKPVETEETFTEPTATAWAASDIDFTNITNDTIGNYTGKYYKISGTVLYKDGDKLAAKLPDATSKILNLYMSNSMTTTYTAIADQPVIVYGYVRGNSTGSKYITIQVVKIELAGTTEGGEDGDSGSAGTDTPDPSANDGSSVEKALTVEELYTKYAALTSDSISSEKVYVKGIISSATSYNESFKSWTFYFKSNLANSQQAQAYSTQLKSPITTICQNDEIVIYGYVKNYNGLLEVAYDSKLGSPEVVSRTIGTSTISFTANENADITLGATSGANGGKFTFTVVAKNGSTVSKVFVNGKVVTALTDGSYEGVINGNTVVSVEALAPVVGEQTATVDLTKKYATYAEDWGTSYGAHTITSADLGISNMSLDVVFTNANKQNSGAAIDNMPVVASKGSNQYVTISVSSLHIKSATFNLQQWGTKQFAKLMLEYTTDGTTWTAVGGVGQSSGTSNNYFAADLSTGDLPENVTAVRLVIYATGSSNVQIGISGFTIVAE